MTPRLETDRLVLREWRDTDREPFAALNADPVVMEHFPSTLTAAQSDEMVDRNRERWRNDGYGLWATERRDSGEFIGYVGVMSPLWEAAFTPCVEVGWRLAARHWGNGFAPEAATAALDFAFANVELPNDEVVSFTTEANTNSRRVMEKLGLKRDADGDFDHPLLGWWSGRRHVLYRIGRSRWMRG